MIYLSAQPDDTYFIWQLEIQLKNFNSFSINGEDIHVLIGFNEEKGLNHLYVDLSKRFEKYAKFFFYPDKRIRKQYVSSIRPHIIAQHFQVYTELGLEDIFYHDSDIIFTHALPDFERLCKDDIWYLSDAHTYLDSTYINDKGDTVLEEMCEIVGISAKQVIENDNNAGGAQALIKKVDYKFWLKIELDSENLYELLFENTKKYRAQFLKKKVKRNYVPISSWCADMWALLWNGILVAQVKIDKDLDFCWPHNDHSAWYDNKIFHNAGVNHLQDKQYFFKGNFMEEDPYDYDFSFVSPQSCSYKYLEAVSEFSSDRVYSFEDVTFLMAVRVDSTDRLENIFASLTYLTNNFKTNIILFEADINSKIPVKDLPEGVTYIFKEDHNPIFLRQFYINRLSLAAETNIVIKYDCDVIIAASQLNKAVLSIRHGESQLCYPYDGTFVNVAGALRKFFVKKPDIRCLFKYITIPNQSFTSYGGCQVLDREAYINAGMDNEAFNGWGHEDKELFKRFKILGLEIKRQIGPLFHLDHKRLSNSHYFSEAEMKNSFKEYIKICRFNKPELKTYISNWHKENGKV
ncbi:N-terminal domain of galactosyltransferase [Pedobacter terrae]|uniref:N-terminal domain of galactosyltransferase n=1 Tax=Pedobacter terrae TaxID=405671 RepID=A0A1G8CKT4_9SPHI|nr:galactosyltransferase-related protein [Pedobacter terrae]SDH45530.1 N-terminal domain of galactosyltransferase [Pedobacter terrae]